MRFEIVNRNETGFQHFVLIPTIELISEFYDDEDLFGWENSLGISFLNFSIWVIWI